METVHQILSYNHYTLVVHHIHCLMLLQQGLLNTEIYIQISFPDITRILYERAKPPLSKNHWLTVEWAGMSGDGYVYIRLDKSNQRQVRAALNAFGFEVEVLTDD